MIGMFKDGVVTLVDATNLVMFTVAGNPVVMLPLLSTYSGADDDGNAEGRIIV